MKEKIEDYLEGLLSKQEQSELFKEIDQSAELQSYFLSQLRMHQTLDSLNGKDNEKLISSISSALDDEDGQLTAEVMSKLIENKRSEQRKFRRRTTYALLASAAAILFGFIVIFSGSLKKDNKETVRVDKNGRPIVNGEILKTADEKKEKPRYNNLERLAGTQYKELIMPSGVRVLLQGPAQYTIRGENSLRLEKGRLLASVPEKAIGFSVSTPDGKITDLSTEFGVKVGVDGTGIHVLKGSVEAGLHGETPVVLKEGSALNLNRNDRRVKQLYYDGSSFAKSIPLGKVISINFGGQAGVVGRTGIVPAENWNNVHNSTTDQFLMDDAGKLLDTSVEVNWKGIHGTAEVKEVKTEMQRLFKGRINHTHSSSNEEKPIEPMIIKVKNVKFKKYDLYVFYWIGRRFDDHCFDLQVNGGEKYRIHRPTADSLDSEDEFILWQGVGRNKSGNTQVFKNLSTTDVEIKSILPEGDFDIHRSWFICGLQIVEKE